MNIKTLITVAETIKADKDKQVSLNKGLLFSTHHIPREELGLMVSLFILNHKTVKVHRTSNELYTVELSID